MRVPEYSGNLRSNFIHVPKEIEKANGIRIFGRLIKSIRSEEHTLNSSHRR